MLRASCNPVDTKISLGNLPMGLKFTVPFVIGRDFSGIVSKIPKSTTTTFREGNRVAAFLQPQLYETGLMAEYVCITPNALSFLPPTMSLDHAAGLPLVANLFYSLDTRHDSPT